MRFPVFTLALLFLGNGIAEGQTTVRGQVVDDETERPIASAAVTLLQADRIHVQVFSGPDGSFELDASRAGTFTIRVERLGYATQTTPALILHPAEILDVELRMAVEVVLLAPITITARRHRDPGRDQFRRRRAYADGVFIDEVQIALMEPRVPTDVFRTVDGFWVERGSSGRATIESLRGWGCFMVFLDHNTVPIMRTVRDGAVRRPMGLRGATMRQPGQRGATLFPDGEQPSRADETSARAELDLDAVVDSRQIRGIEIYQEWSDIPEEIRQTPIGARLAPDESWGTCGIAIIWTIQGW